MDAVRAEQVPTGSRKLRPANKYRSLALLTVRQVDRETGASVDPALETESLRRAGTDDFRKAETRRQERVNCAASLNRPACVAGHRIGYPRYPKQMVPLSCLLYI